MSTKAAAYLRVSGKAQVLGDGFDRQLSTIQKRAELDEFTIVSVVEEKAISGTKETVDRPALTDLLQSMLQTPDVRTILVERADRIARDLIVSELLLKECRKLGIQIIDSECGRELTKDDPDDPTSKLIRQILAAVAEFDKSSIVKRLRVARRRWAEKTNGQRGREGTKPYGHTSRPWELLGLNRLIELAREGRGPVSIAVQLTREKIGTRHGKPWTKQSVHAILRRLKISREIASASV